MKTAATPFLQSASSKTIYLISMMLHYSNEQSTSSLTHANLHFQLDQHISLLTPIFNDSATKIATALDALI